MLGALTENCVGSFESFDLSSLVFSLLFRNLCLFTDIFFTSIARECVCVLEGMSFSKIKIT